MKSIEATWQDIQQGLLTFTQVVTSCLERIEESNHCNIYIEVYREEALAKAKKLDEKVSNGERIGSMLGGIVALKDNLCYAGHTVTAASAILKDFVSPYTATAVQHLLDEDAIIIGRVNCDEFAMGSATGFSVYGPTLNPLDTSRAPGGSSGGSAAAVAAKTCHVALGSDTGGSIRQPASFCGTYGLKPTYGRISRHGLIAFASSFDQIGPFSHSVDDISRVTHVMASKPCAFDSTSIHKAWLPNKSKDNLRVASFSHLASPDYCSEDVQKNYHRSIEELKACGITVETKEFTLIDYMLSAYYILTTAEASSNLSRFDGMRYGHRSEKAESLEEVYTMSRSEGFGKEVKNRIMLGTFVLSSGYYDAYYEKAMRARQKVRNFFDKLLKDYDAIAMPTSPTTAFAQIAQDADGVEQYNADIFTVVANLTGHPALSIPNGLGSDNLPTGFQLVGRMFEEERLLNIAKEMKSL